MEIRPSTRTPVGMLATAVALWACLGFGACTTTPAADAGGAPGDGVTTQDGVGFGSLLDTTTDGPGTVSDAGDGPGTETTGAGGTDTGSGGGTGVIVPCTIDGDCPADLPACKNAKCVECTADGHCASPTPYCSVATTICLACVLDEHCPAEASCNNGACVSDSCAPGATLCSGVTLLTCSADGTGWDPSPCPSGACEAGACVECSPQCQGGLLCWQGGCVDCKPGSKRCQGNDVQQCDEAGTWQHELDCAEQALVCSDPGYCASACGGDPKFNYSNSGCEYWAVDLDNHYGAQDSPFAVIVSNLTGEVATVTVSQRDHGAAEPVEVTTRSVPANALEIINLPARQPDGARIGWNAYRIQSDNQIIAYQFNPLDNVDVFSNDASLLLPVNTFGQEYRILTMPELLGGGPPVPPGQSCPAVCGALPGGVCLDDGTGSGTQACSVPYRGTLTVVASLDATVVTVFPSTTTLAGDGVPAMVAGQAYNFELQPYQVLNLKSDAPGGDLTGTRVTADKPIGVFAGHEAAITSDKCCADHLEQQMFPVNTWGSQYVASKAFTRGQEDDYWRVLAANDGTIVTFTPSVAPDAVLDAGDWIQIESNADFVIAANGPIAVAQVLASSQETLFAPPGAPCAGDYDCHPGYLCLVQGVFDKRCVPPGCDPANAGGGQGCPSGHACTCLNDGCFCLAIGDPALISHASQEQYRTDYVFLTPDKYQDDYVNIIAETGTQVTLDDFLITPGYFEAIGSSGWGVTRLKLSDGNHRLSSDKPVGVVVYGFDRDVSYGYTAGLNLQKL